MRQREKYYSHYYNKRKNNPQKDPNVNMYYIHADAAWDRMTKIYEGKYPYIYDDYSQLINTLERYYKGFLLTMFNNIPGYKFPLVEHHEKEPLYFLEGTHNLAKLTKHISDKFFNVSNTYTNEGLKQFNDKLYKLQKDYTDARYRTTPSKKEFSEAYEFADSQIKNLKKYQEQILSNLKEDKDIERTS